MTAKEYLSQAHRLEQRVSNKLMLIESLRSMTQRVTSTIRENAVSHTSNVTSLQDTIIRLMEAENELNQQIDSLVDLKRDIMLRINELSSIDHQLILEKRYLQYLAWHEIAQEMEFSLRWVHRVHEKALKAFDEILQKQEETS